MPLDTHTLIRQLANEAEPLEPLPRPWTRVAVWLAVSLPFLLLVLALWPSEGPLAVKLSDRRFLIEEAAAAATAIAAGLAAFATTIPGTDRRVALAPLAPLAVWVAQIGTDCFRNAGAVHGLAILGHWPCLAVTVVAGAIPAAAMAVMLRRGAPIAPHLSTALGGLAVGSLANLAVRTIHAYDTSLLVLIWHVGASFLFALTAAAIGRGLLRWNVPAPLLEP